MIAKDEVWSNTLATDSPLVLSWGWTSVYVTNHHLSLSQVHPKPFNFHKCFHAAYRVSNSSKLSAIITKSSACNTSQGRALLHCLERASRTVTNKKGLKTCLFLLPIRKLEIFHLWRKLVTKEWMFHWISLLSLFWAWNYNMNNYCYRGKQLTHFSPVLYFYTPWKHQQTKVFWHSQRVKKWDIGLK